MSVQMTLCPPADPQTRVATAADHQDLPYDMSLYPTGTNAFAGMSRR